MSLPDEVRTDGDAGLVADARAGKPGAFERLFAKYWRWVMKIALSRIEDEMEAEDAAIETFEDVARGLAGFRGESSFSTWVFRCTMNRVKHHIRTSRARPSLVPASETDLPSSPLEEQHELRGQVEAVLRDIRRLPAAQAEAFTLRRLEGLELSEVAAALGVSNATAGMRITRATETLLRMRRARERPG
jgi:RNA polymerase sigma-70 factor (ECF subfamily)